MTETKLQCKDIPDLPILRFIASHNGDWCNLFDTEGAAGSEKSVFHAMPDDTPWKLGLAKMRMLLRRGLVDGCGCGCRGDFFLTDKGREFLQKAGDV